MLSSHGIELEDKPSELEETKFSSTHGGAISYQSHSATNSALGGSKTKQKLRDIYKGVAPPGEKRYEQRIEAMNGYISNL